jgi:Na+-translocating ferredoxin:NAD+ oxidoreductase RnfD subunit
LAILVVLAAPHEGLGVVAPTFLAAISAAAVLDAIILRKKRGAWEFPDGALLTGMIAAMVLSPHQPWWVFAGVGAIGIITKHLFRTRSANVFNPAALALVVSFYVFDTGQNWWGALPELPTATLIVLFLIGVFITDRVNKIPLVLMFLGAYYALFTLTSLFGNPQRTAEIFRSPDLHASLFFAFFILTDPPTSPVKYPDQLICGALVAVVSYAFFQFVGAVYFLLAGVLAGNIWEAWRRQSSFRRRRLDREVSPAAAR